MSILGSGGWGVSHHCDVGPWQQLLLKLIQQLAHIVVSDVSSLTPSISWVKYPLVQMCSASVIVSLLDQGSNLRVVHLSLTSRNNPGHICVFCQILVHWIFSQLMYTKIEPSNTSNSLWTSRNISWQVNLAFYLSCV